MIRRIEHFIIRSCGSGLEITQDQREEMRRALIFVLAMMIATYLFSPYGYRPIPGFSALWFWGVEAGWSVSALVAWYATSYTKTHMFTNSTVTVTERHGGKVIDRKTYRHTGRLQVEVHHQPYNRGPKIAHTPIRVGGPGRLKIYPYTLRIHFPDNSSIKMSLSRRKSTEFVLAELAKVVELQVST